MFRALRTKGLEVFNSFSSFGYFVFFGLLSQITSILLPPNPSISGTKEALCNYYITKLNIFHVHIDCDSQYFLLDSQNPSRLLSDQTPLQDRPVHVYFVYLVSKLLGFLGIPQGSITYVGEDKIPQTYNVLNYSLFIILNGVILAASIIIVLGVFFRSRENLIKASKLTIFCVLILIAQNPINREFFWTPHSQIFNILVPALLFYLAQENLVLNRKSYYIWLSFIGISLLVYPTFSILLPILMLRAIQTLGVFHGLLIVISLVPKFLWPLIVDFYGGNYVDWPVVGHRRFVWILDSIQANTLWHDSVNNFSKFLNSLPLTWDVVTISMMLIAITLRGKCNGVKILSTRSSHFYASFVLAIYTIGMAVNGEYGPRFTSGIVLLLSFIVLKEISQSKEKAFFWNFVLYVCIIANFLYWFTS